MLSSGYSSGGGGGLTEFQQESLLQMQLRLMLCDHWDNPVVANLKTWRECLQANASAAEAIQLQPRRPGLSACMRRRGLPRLFDRETEAGLA
jgi:hypothetical protein